MFLLPPGGNREMGQRVDQSSEEDLLYNHHKVDCNLINIIHINIIIYTIKNMTEAFELPLSMNPHFIN